MAVSPFGVDQCVRLVVWFLFLYWEPYEMRKRNAKYYEQHLYRLDQMAIPAPWFMIIWTILKGLMVAAIFLFMEYYAVTKEWTFYAVYGTFFALVVFSKFWTMIFFGWHRYLLALLLAMVLAALAACTTIFMWLARDQLGDLWWLPGALMIAPTVWYFVAIALTWQWMNSIHHGQQQEEFGGNAPFNAAAEIMLRQTRSQTRRK